MLNLRCLLSRNGTITDISKDVVDYKKVTKEITFNTAQDFLYIGAYYPFNSKYFNFVVPFLTTLGSFFVKYWTGTNGWKDAVETIDETDGMTKSGFLSWNPDRDHGWSREHTEDIDELDSLKIYDLFWTKISFSGVAGDRTCSLDYIGEIFSDDRALGYEFPDLLRTQAMTSFQSGKTDWKDQHAISAKIILDDMRSKKIINFKEQILNRRELELASVSKTAEIIYSSFGQEFQEQKLEAHKEYVSRMNKDIFNIDRSETAQVTERTLQTRQGNFYR